MRKLALVVFLLALSTPKALGWGKEGHVIVAKIAEYNLSERTKVELQKLGFDSISTDAVANYADKVRRNKNYPQYFKSGPWHFVDLPIGECSSFADVKEYIEKHKPNVVSQIRHYADVLADKNRSREEKQEAVKFIVHFVGDVHQPLHCANRNNDHGGNALKVLFLGIGGNYLNLHHVWDTNLVKRLMDGRSPEDTAKWLAQENPYKPDNMNIDSWAYESYIDATRYAYRMNRRPLPTSGTPKLDERYADEGAEVVHRRLQQAGVRLAKLLNDIFDK
jgi:hypothetical protein